MSVLETGPVATKYDETLSRHADWLFSHQNPDGSLQGEEISCAVYMPMPLYGHVTGRHDLSAASWHFLEKKFIRDGRLVQAAARGSMMPYTPAWLVMGASLEENLHVRTVLLKDLLSYQDKKTGGFFGSATSRDAGQGLIDFDSTTQACTALAIAGRDEAAIKAGQYLRRLVENQPDAANRLYLQTDSAKGLVRDGYDPKSTDFLLVYSQPKAWLYKIGLLARAFAFLHQITGETVWLDLAETHYRRAADKSPDIWTNTLSHKMGWASWILYRITGKRGYAEDACKMADHLMTIQQDDGGFAYPELWSSYEAAPLDLKLNIGAQFATWIHYARAMSRA